MRVKNLWERSSRHFFEFLRYIIVGGSAFVLDFLIMYLCNEYIFKDNFLYLSVFLGYTIGLIYNFLLSCAYVFKDGFKKIKNKELQSFIIFTIIGIIGLVLTEILMFIFVDIMNINYMISKIITGAIVVFWNYIARKVIIFKD